MIEFDRGKDSLLRDVPLRHAVGITVLGVPVHFSSNSPAAIAVAEAAFGAWRHYPLAHGDADEVRVDLVVQPGDEGGAEHARLYYRVLAGLRVLFASHGSVGVADPQLRHAAAYVTPSLVADEQHFRYGVVEAMTMALLTPLDRQPFHAAAIVRNGSALLLAARSGVGKSSLAYAAARAGQGIEVLAEDIVFLQSRPRLRVWGLPGFVHLPPEAEAVFPELTAMAPTLKANGKTKIAVDLRALGRIPATPVVERAALCVLTRDGGRPGPRRVDAHELLARLAPSLREPGFDMFEPTIHRPLELLAGEGGWLLDLGRDPREAVPWIEAMLDDVAIPAA